MTDTNRDWHRAFKAWLKGWTREIYEGFRVDPVWFAAYKLAFRAGWRARGRAS